MPQIAPCVNTLCSYVATSWPEHARCQLRREDRVRRVVARERPVRHQLRWHTFGRDLLGGLAEGERLGLREQVRREQVMVEDIALATFASRLAEPDEVARDELRALVDQLVERVLPVGAGLTPHDRPGLVRRRRRPPCRPTCRCSPCRAAGGTPGTGRGTGEYGSTACVSAPRKSSYQTPRRPSSTGRLRSYGAVRKCSSISWKPASISRNRSGPIATISDSPIAES